MPGWKINYSRSAIFHILMRKFRFKIYILMGPCTTGSMSYKLNSTLLNKTLNHLHNLCYTYLEQKWRDFKYSHSSPLSSHRTSPVAADRKKLWKACFKGLVYPDIFQNSPQSKGEKQFTNVNTKLSALILRRYLVLLQGLFYLFWWLVCKVNSICQIKDKGVCRQHFFQS